MSQATILAQWSVGIGLDSKLSLIYCTYPQHLVADYRFFSDPNYGQSSYSSTVAAMLSLFQVCKLLYWLTYSVPTLFIILRLPRRSTLVIFPLARLFA